MSALRCEKSWRTSSLTFSPPPPPFSHSHRRLTPFPCDHKLTETRNNEAALSVPPSRGFLLFLYVAAAGGNTCLRFSICNKKIYEGFTDFRGFMSDTNKRRVLGEGEEKLSVPVPGDSQRVHSHTVQYLEIDQSQLFAKTVAFQTSRRWSIFPYSPFSGRSKRRPEGLKNRRLICTDVIQSFHMDNLDGK